VSTLHPNRVQPAHTSTLPKPAPTPHTGGAAAAGHAEPRRRPGQACARAGAPLSPHTPPTASHFCSGASHRDVVQAAELVAAAAAEGRVVSFEQLLFEPGWAAALNGECTKPYWTKLEAVRGGGAAQGCAASDRQGARRCGWRGADADAQRVVCGDSSCRGSGRVKQRCSHHPRWCSVRSTHVPSRV
jgi:hypothetical protein